MVRKASNSVKSRKENGAVSPSKLATPRSKTYQIENQVGFLLRRVHRRATAIFQNLFSTDELTPLQFTSLIKIRDERKVSQNLLGRLSHADPATIMGVVSRLEERKLVKKGTDPFDKRKSILVVTTKGLKLLESLEPVALQVSEQTLAPLSSSEQKIFLRLLTRLA